MVSAVAVEYSPPYKGGDAALKAQLGWSLTPKNCSVSDHPGAPSLEAAPYRACAVAPPLLRKEGILQAPRTTVVWDSFKFRVLRQRVND